MPSLRSSNEMKVVATATRISENVKWLVLYSGLGFLSFWAFYKYIAIYSEGSLTLTTESLIVRTRKTIYQIAITDIRRIELINPKDLKGNFKEKFHVVIFQINDKVVNFRFKNYSDSDSFVDHLLTYDTARISIQELDSKSLSLENV